MAEEVHLVPAQEDAQLTLSHWCEAALKSPIDPPSAGVGPKWMFAKNTIGTMDNATLVATLGSFPGRSKMSWASSTYLTSSGAHAHGRSLWGSSCRLFGCCSNEITAYFMLRIE